MAALAGEDVPGSRDHFGRAWQAARTQPELFSLRQIANFGQRHAFALIRLGDGAAAEKAFRPLVAEMTRLVGRDHPDTLFLRDRKSTRLNSSPSCDYRMQSSARTKKTITTQHTHSQKTKHT